MLILLYGNKSTIYDLIKKAPLFLNQTIGAQDIPRELHSGI